MVEPVRECDGMRIGSPAEARKTQARRLDIASTPVPVRCTGALKAHLYRYPRTGSFIILC
jgi:hypothetical protein